MSITSYEEMSPQGLDLQERVIEINRVAKVVKGGRRFSFTALVAVGDERSVVGIGYGKAREVPLAIQKAVETARKNLIKVPQYGQTLPHFVIGRFGAGHVVLRPASEGTGVIAGGGVRAVLELAGYRDVLTKSIGTNNAINQVKATMAGLKALRKPEDVAELRGLSVNQVLGIQKEKKADAAAEGDAAEKDAVRAVDVVAAEKAADAASGAGEGEKTKPEDDESSDGPESKTPDEGAATAAAEATEPPSDGGVEPSTGAEEPSAEEEEESS